MRLKYQLFLTLLLVSALLITLMALINSWSFDRGFVGYINATERQRLAPLVDELAAGYLREGSWDWIVSDRTIDSHIKKLRQKLRSISADAEYIQSVYGIGYKFERTLCDGDGSSST